MLLIFLSLIFFPGLLHAVTLPGFRVVPVISNLTLPTTVRFAPDGRVFVAEKSGIIKVFSNLEQTTTPNIIDLLPPVVYDFWDRGLLGMAIHPEFPQQPYIYVLYSYDKKIPEQRALGNGTERWEDDCPDPPGANNTGCVTNSRLSRIMINAESRVVGNEQVLLDGDWCMQYPSHTIGSLEFGPDGALYVTGGDGASFTFIDHGQEKNLCRDPLNAPGIADNEGGAFRSLDLLTGGDPQSFDGTLLRIDPETGEAMPNNPLVGGTVIDDDRIVAYGLRNPFRFTLRPGTSEIFIGDVGMNKWEEINRVADPLDGIIENFGWPCFEGSYTDVSGPISMRQAGYESFDVCQGLYNGSISSAITAPFYSYDHDKTVVARETCSSGGSSVTGLAFYVSESYPVKFKNALFFADASRECIWAISLDANGNLNPKTRSNFLWGAGVGQVVDLRTGPGGDLFYVDIAGGVVNRVVFFSGNQPPIVKVSADKTSGTTPLTVRFDASQSTDPDNLAPLSFAWDLDGDGVFDDAIESITTHTYNMSGTFIAAVQVSDGNSVATSSVSIQVGNNAPAAMIVNPMGSFAWRVGSEIMFAGQGTDKEDGTLPPSAMKWSIVMNHCMTQGDCHAHVVKEFDGVASGKFTAPDHEYPASIELQLTVTDSGGLKQTVRNVLQPTTIQVAIDTMPRGLNITVGAQAKQTPFTVTAIEGSQVTINAVSPQILDGKNYVFESWSDNGAQSHEVIAGRDKPSFRATFAEPAQPDSSPGPLLDIRAEQNGNLGRIIGISSGNVTLRALTTQAPRSDRRFVWEVIGATDVDGNANNETFVFSPSDWEAGLYNASVIMQDGAAELEADILLQAMAALPILKADVDADKDGINDLTEGYGDADNDGVANFLDSHKSPQVQRGKPGDNNYLLNTEAGLFLRLGSIALLAGNGSTSISEPDLRNARMTEDSLTHIGGLFDWEVVGLASSGQSIKVVIPLHQTIPANAVLRFVDVNGSWQDFTVNGSNGVTSAPATLGACEFDMLAVAGLTQGHACLRLTLNDGGPNDGDGKANGRVRFLGGLAGRPVAGPANNPSPPASSGGGGGALSLLSLVWLITMWRWRWLFRVK